MAVGYPTRDAEMTKKSKNDQKHSKTTKNDCFKVKTKQVHADVWLTHEFMWWKLSPRLSLFGQRTRRGRCPIEQRGEFPSVRPSRRANERANERPHKRPNERPNERPSRPLSIQPPPTPTLSRPQPPRPLETLPRPQSSCSRPPVTPFLIPPGSISP